MSLSPEEKKQRSRAAYLKSRFNLDELDVKDILLKQKDKCGICDRPMKRPHIDHCHKTGLVRGLLCWPCNRALGNSDVNWLVDAMWYLQNPPATDALGEERYGSKGRSTNKVATRKKLNPKKPRKKKP